MKKTTDNDAEVLVAKEAIAKWGKMYDEEKKKKVDTKDDKK